jgi:hypothetical protein
MDEHEDRRPEDPMPGVLADIDQAIAMMPLLAQYARGVFEAFLEAGFSEAQAMTLTRDQLSRAFDN